MIASPYGPLFAEFMAYESSKYGVGCWNVTAIMRGMPAPVLRYETHLTVPADSVLRRFASVAGQLGISLRVPQSPTHKGLKQQDSGGAAAFKVKNWPEFSKALIEAGLEKRAFGYPI